MARKGRAKPRRAAEPLPPPLPPETRTVGQLVAESVRFYRHRFFQALPLGLSAAALTQLSVAFGRQALREPRGHPPAEGRPHAEALLGGDFVTTAVLGSLLLTLSYIAASVLVSGARPDARRLGAAYTAGALVFLPVPFLTALFVLPAVAWLGLLGFVVPAAVIEGAGLRRVFGRALQLARADYVHAVGGLATLVIVYFVTRIFLLYMLRNVGEATERIAAFLADLVLSPFLFVGAVLLYFDQAARARSRAPG